MDVQWSLVIFTVISGAGAWLFAFSMIQSLVKRGALPTVPETIVSAILLIIGGVASVTHLSHPDRILNALQHPTSGIFVEAMLIGVSLVLMLVYFILYLRKAPKPATATFGVLTMAVCIIFSFMCGESYLMEARAAWMTIALPLAYMGTGA
ncbi:MAG: dimethyl sulfoxide reductase anchor subunit, partial [Eggerthellaceae bacterium]|nr:dimethyl sulfoxide reductase anchor subunit [Eggerthellaceae bacterium]